MTRNALLATLLNTLIQLKKLVLIVKNKKNTIIKLLHANALHPNPFKPLPHAYHAIFQTILTIKTNNADYVKSTIFITLISSNV
jgi:hypothetical protein